MGFNYLANQEAVQQAWARFERPINQNATTPTFGFHTDVFFGIDYRFRVAHGLADYQLTAVRGQAHRPFRGFGPDRSLVRTMRFLVMKTTVAILAVLGAALAVAAEPPPPQAAPPVTIDLDSRDAQGMPTRVGFTHTGGGNIDVQQPSPDTVIITMTGVAVAGGHPCKDSLAALAFELCQEFEIIAVKPEVKKAKLTIEARVIGLLRTHKCGGGSAAINCPAHALVFPSGVVGEAPAVIEVSLPGRAVGEGESLSVNDKCGPVAAVLPPGKFVLREQFGVQASHPKKLFPCKAASAEFAPDPALDPLWISGFEPFHGAQKKDFGFQVMLKASPE